MDTNVYTAGFVTLGAVATGLIGLWTRRQDRQEKLLLREQDREEKQTQRDWDIEDRATKSNLVLAAVQANTVVSTVASEAAVAVNEKLAAVVPGTETDRVLANMLNVDAISPGDIARVLIDIKTTVDVLEDYAHKSVHRLNNLLATLQKVPDRKE